MIDLFEIVTLWGGNAGYYTTDYALARMRRYAIISGREIVGLLRKKEYCDETCKKDEPAGDRNGL